MKKNNIFGNILKTYRKKMNLSQEQLATILNTSKSRICLYEIGRRKPNKKFIKKITDKTNIEYEQLYIATLLDKESIDILTLEKYIKIYKGGI